MFTQSDSIRDYVFPIVAASANRGELSVKRFLGTGFLIGNRGFGLTAAHVTKGFGDETAVAIFVPESGGWFGFPIIRHEMHESEDVAVVKINGGPWKSIFKLANTWEGSSMRYRMFGYPEDAADELVLDDKAQLRPDLVYTEGYIRRRTGHEIPAMIGTRFFELSDVAGPGCSGSPVFKFTASALWDVVGVYAGEKINESATSVAYAVREDAFRDWIPEVLGTSVLAESQNVST